MIEEADKHQTNLLIEIMSFRNNTKSRNQEKKRDKETAVENLYNVFEGTKKTLDAFESKMFSIRGAGILNPNHSKLKILTHKEML